MKKPNKSKDLPWQVAILIKKKKKNIFAQRFNAQIKLTELWKAVNEVDHPFKISKISDDTNRNVTRASANGILKSPAHSIVTQKTCINDGIKAWNRAPQNVKNCMPFTSAKHAIKEFVQNLPI